MSHRSAYIVDGIATPEIATPASNPAQYKRKIYVKSTGKLAVLDYLGNEETIALDSAVVHDTGAESIDGVKTFTSLPESSVTPTTANQLVNKAYVDSISTLLSIRSITGDATATTSNDLIKVTCSSVDVTVTLYSAAGNDGRQITIKKMDATAYKVIIEGTTGETIDGALTQDILYQWDSLTLVADGGQWLLI